VPTLLLQILCSVNMFCSVFLSEMLSVRIIPFMESGRDSHIYTYKTGLQILASESGRQKVRTGPNDNELSSGLICYKFESEFHLDQMIYTKSNDTFNCH
jgi:hypothetical protein